jgi:hypothetical protein
MGPRREQGLFVPILAAHAAGTTPTHCYHMQITIAGQKIVKALMVR